MATSDGENQSPAYEGISRLVSMERVGEGVPVEAAAGIFRDLRSEKYPDAILESAAEVASGSLNSNFCTLFAVLSQCRQDQHAIAGQIIARRLELALHTLDHLEEKTLAHIQLATTLLGLIDKDSRNRASARANLAPTLDNLADRLFDLSSRKNQIKTRVWQKTLFSLLDCAKELDEGDLYLKINQHMLDKYPAEFNVLVELLAIARSGFRAPYDRLNRARKLVIDRLDIQFPSASSYAALLDNSLARDRKSFGKYGFLVARVFGLMGREKEAIPLFGKFMAGLDDCEAKAAMAQGLLKLRSRWALSHASTLMSDKAVRGACSISARLRMASVLADWPEVESILGSASPRDAAEQQTFAWTHQQLGNFEIAKALVEVTFDETCVQLATEPTSSATELYEICSRWLSELKFLCETKGRISGGCNGSKPKGIVILVGDQPQDLCYFPLLSLESLKREGYALYALSGGMLCLETGQNSSDMFANVHGMVGESGMFHNLEPEHPIDFYNDWQVDLSRGIAACKGIDFFMGINEAIRCHLRRFSIDFTDSYIHSECMKTCQQMDLIISVIDHLKSIATTDQIPIRLMVRTHHYGLGYAARKYIETIAENGDLAIIGCADGYDNYFDNFSREFSSTLAVCDLTSETSKSRAAAVSPERFRTWFSQRRTSETAVSATRHASEVGPREWLAPVFAKRINRANFDASASDRLLLLKQKRAEGCRVACLFGKVLFDLASPVEGGPAHSDLKDWFDHCLELANRDKDLILLIKPHPHEVRNEISLYPSERLRDWLPISIPSNVIVLGHDEFNVHELAPVLDVGLVWNSTVALELGVLGVPCIVCSWCGCTDYPVGHFVPKDKQDFTELLVNAKSLLPDPETAQKSSALLQYLRTTEVSVPYRYVYRTISNRKIRKFGWIKDDLQSFTINGDNNVDLIANVIYASFSRFNG